MPRPRFNKFYRYDELTKLLKAYVKEYPKLFKLESIGKSYEGRDVWLITATNFKSGDDADKPALWVDGNIHASEVTASAACLYFIHTLATKYGKDKQGHGCAGYARILYCAAPQSRWRGMGTG